MIYLHRFYREYSQSELKKIKIKRQKDTFRKLRKNKTVVIFFFYAKILFVSKFPMKYCEDFNIALFERPPPSIATLVQTIGMSLGFTFHTTKNVRLVNLFGGTILFSAAEITKFCLDYSSVTDLFLSLEKKKVFIHLN